MMLLIQMVIRALVIYLTIGCVTPHKIKYLLMSEKYFYVVEYFDRLWRNGCFNEKRSSIYNLHGIFETGS